jgi:hypothetical protein
MHKSRKIDLQNIHRYYTVRNNAAEHDISKPPIHDAAVQASGGNRMQFNAFRRVTIHNVSTETIGQIRVLITKIFI